MASDFPTALAARQLLAGQPGALAENLWWTAKRAVLIGTGIALTGQREQLFKRAFFGSLAVTAFMVTYQAVDRDNPVATSPSVGPALAGDWLGIFVTYFLRSLIVAAGMYLAGIRTHLLRDAFAGTALIEAAVLEWARENKI